MSIRFQSPQYEFQFIRHEWLAAIEKWTESGVYVGGPAVSGFEQAFSEFVGTDFAAGVGNGTDALFLALKSLGIGPGDEVITVANTFVATVEAIYHTGARPILVDCDPETHLLSLNEVKRSVTSRTKAIIPVHLYGQMVDLFELVPWAAERNIYIVEDCAQATGARYKGKSAGSCGDLGCFSFFPGKNLGAIGDGGGVTTSDPSLYLSLKKLRNHGSEKMYQHEIPGFNSRLDPIQAITLEIKLKYLDAWSNKRRELAHMYEYYLDKIGMVQLPKHRNDGSHVFHVYAVRTDREIRDRLKKHLQKKGILTAIHYPEPVHLTKAFAHLGYNNGDFPWSERNALEMISLPMHIALEEKDIAEISREISEVLGSVQV